VRTEALLHDPMKARHNAARSPFQWWIYAGRDGLPWHRAYWLEENRNLPPRRGL